MSSLNINYYFLNKQSLDFNNIINTLKIDNNKIKDWCLQYDFINCQLQDLLEIYPKTLIQSNVIDFSTKKYNQNKILSSTSMSEEQLNKNIIDDNCHNLISIIKNIPNTYDDLNKEQIFQDNYIIKFNQIYNKNFYIYNYSSNEFRSNFFSLFDKINILDDNQLQILESQSFFHLFFLKSFMTDYFMCNSNLKNNLLNNIDTLTLQNININNDDFKSDIIKIILINQYGFTNVTDDFINEVVPNLTSFSDVFNNYLLERSSEFKINFTQTFYDLFNHKFSFDFINTIFTQSKYFNFKSLNSLSYDFFSVSELSQYEDLQLQINYINSLNNFEQKIVYSLQLILNEYVILKQYLYLLYLNRFQYEKFINIIDLVISTYIFNNISLDNIYYFNTHSHLQLLFLEWKNSVYLENLKKIITKENTKEKQHDFLDNNTDIIKFSYIYEIYNIIEDFIQTDVFSDYLKIIQKEIYDHLRSSGNIDHDIDWCSCNIPLKVFFMSFLKELFLDVDFSKDVIIDYIKTQIDKSEFTTNDFDFDSFINNNSSKMFTFYQNMVSNTISSLFTNMFHNIYKL